MDQEVGGSTVGTHSVPTVEARSAE